MNFNHYKVLSCEGADQVGKADAILNLRNRLANNSISVTYSSFPIYASPFGTTIRLFLKNGINNLNISHMDELRVRMTLFALDRLEFLDVLLSNEKYKDTFVILDRSCFSNALTIAYGMSSFKDITEKDAEELVKNNLEFESFMIKALNLKKCVVQLISKENKWGNIRSKNADQHERREVQEMSDYTYSLYAKKVGEGWNQIVTKDLDGWRDREEISNEIFDAIHRSFGKVEKSKNFVNYHISIKEVLSDIYPNSKYSKKDLDEYLDALINNDKDRMYEYGIKIGKDTASSCPAVILRNEDVRNEFRRLIDMNPKILDVLGNFVGENFCIKLLKALDYD